MEEKGFRFLNIWKLKYQTSSEKIDQKKKEYVEVNLEEENFNAC